MKWFLRLERIEKFIVVGAVAAVVAALPVLVMFWDTYVIKKRVELVFEPRVTLEVLAQPPGPPLRYYDFQFMVRNAGSITADKLYYKFVFPSETVIPEDQRFGLGDRSLWLTSDKRLVTFEGKKYYSLGNSHKEPIFSGRSMNMGNMSLRDPLKEFSVQWKLSWEGGTYPEGERLGTMTFENGRIKVDPAINPAFR